jgi:dTMP kinase
MELNQRSLLVVFGGIDGAGKSTHANSFAKRLAFSGIKVLLTRQPYYGYPEIIEQTFSPKKVDPLAQLFLFAADRAQHVHQVIMPALRRNTVVICDRWTFCTHAYQGAGLGVTKEQIEAVNEIAVQGLKPDIAFLLDIPVSLAMERLKKRDTLTPTEQLGDEFFERVRSSYIEQYEQGHFDFLVHTDCSIDRELNTDFIFNQAVELLR